MKFQNKAFSIVYIFFIITFILFLGIVVMNKQAYFTSSNENRLISNILYRTIINKFNINLNSYWTQNFSTWTISTLSWIVSKNTGYYNIFWTPQDLKSFIDTNTNIGYTDYARLSNTSSWMLFFDINADFKLKIVEFDNAIYNQSKHLSKINEINITNNTSWVHWYLQENGVNFSLMNSNPMYFDFKNKNYWFFLEYNTWSLSYLNYSIKAYDISWSWVYINPIKDDTENQIYYLWNHVIMYNWKYISLIKKLNTYKR